MCSLGGLDSISASPQLSLQPIKPAAPVQTELPPTKLNAKCIQIKIFGLRIAKCDENSVRMSLKCVCDRCLVQDKPILLCVEGCYSTYRTVETFSCIILTTRIEYLKKKNTSLFHVTWKKIFGTTFLQVRLQASME